MASSSGHKLPDCPICRNAASCLHKLLECPICINCMYPPIHQCSNGHTICSNCKARVDNKCPVCRQPLGDNRCLALEQVAETLGLPCKYSEWGCSGTFSYYDKLDHEPICNFRPFNCPFDAFDCSVTGHISYLVVHLRDDHKVDMYSGSNFSHCYTSPSPHPGQKIWRSTVIHCLDQYFYFHFHAFMVRTTPVYMAFLRFMGDENEACNYSYTLEVGELGKRIRWEATPHSIRDSFKKIRDSYDGLIVLRDSALLLKDGDDSNEPEFRVQGSVRSKQENQDV